MYARFPIDPTLKSVAVMAVFEVIADSETLLSEALKRFTSSRMLSDLYIPKSLIGECPEGFVGARDGWLWVNPDLSFYVYKITAPSSAKYYIGARQIRVADATVADCEADEYMGSGSSKFKNWLRRHPDVAKEIIRVFKSKAEAYQFEAELIGDSWQTDPLCLNSAAGGKSYGFRTPPKPRFVQKECTSHGLTLHTPKGSCRKCAAASSFVEIVCPKHGKVAGRAGRCVRCSAEKMVSDRECTKHGKTKHNGDLCMKCQSESVFTEGNCSSHGFVTLRSGRCTRCQAESMVRNRLCSTHGEVAHIGSSCGKCLSAERWTMRKCPTHGKTQHQGASCAKCASSDAVALGECPKHGSVTFFGTACTVCRSEAGVSKGSCETHGAEVTMIGSRCRQCVNLATTNLRDCPHHGLVKHQGSKCASCSSMATAHRLHHGRKPNPKCFICKSRGQSTVDTSKQLQTAV